MPDTSPAALCGAQHLFFTIKTHWLGISIVSSWVRTNSSIKALLGRVWGDGSLGKVLPCKHGGAERKPSTQAKSLLW